MKYRDLLIVITLNLLAIFTGLFIVYLIAGQINAVSKVGVAISDLEAGRKNLAETKKVLSGLREDKLKIDEYVVTSQNTDIFLEHLEIVAKQAGVKMNVTSAGVDERGNLTASIGVRGQYGSIIRYLELLSTVHYLVSLNRITLQAPVEKGDVWAGTINMILLSYKK